MLTVLIEDIRSGVTDHQLAEVRVPLFKRQDCLWANSQEVCEQLQASASRIYGKYRGTMLALLIHVLSTLAGPARVYTLRGKYRQFFLRVSGDNVDEITPSNLKISSDRTLDIVVEAVRENSSFSQLLQLTLLFLLAAPSTRSFATTSTDSSRSVVS